MYPDLETMISDIVKWIKYPNTLEIWFGSLRYHVAILGKNWKKNCFWEGETLETCLAQVWHYVDANRE